MCYSAQIDSNLRRLMRTEGVTIEYAEAERIFQRRLTDARIRIPRAFEQNFMEPQNDAEVRIKGLIEQYRADTEKRLTQDLFKQRKRLSDAERSLQTKETKKAREDVRIAGGKIEANRGRLSRLRAVDIDVEDERIFPFWYAPIIVQREAGKTIKLARYHLRQKNAPAFIDQKFPGLYNARRDNLTKFWRQEFGHSHALLVATSFFENVEQDGRNVVLHFNPKPRERMLVACLYSEWTSSTEGEIVSFAAVTDEPPAEVTAAGHDRCIVNLQPNNIDRWLTPEGRSDAELQSILDEKQRPYYEHAIAA